MSYFDVEVKISATEASGQAGAWYPLIYVVGDTSKYNEYNSLTEVMKDYTDGTDAYEIARLIFMQDFAPEKIAILAGAADVKTGLAPRMSESWRQLIVANADKSYDSDLAKFIETTEKMYFTHFADLSELQSAKITDYDRTVAIVYSGTDVNFPEAALVGRTAAYEAGSITYHCKEVKGVTASEFTSSELDNIHSAGGFSYVTKNGRTATSNGITGSGEWIDVMDSYDYLIQNIRYDVQELFLTKKKVPYTNEGITMMSNTVFNRLTVAANNGMIATDDNGNYLFGTDFVPRSGTTVADRASRNYPYGKFHFELAGAVHKAKIIGSVTA